MMIRKQ